MNPLTLRLPDREMEILKEYCEQSGRTQTDVVRSYVRTLEKHIRKINADDIDPLSLPSIPWKMKLTLPDTYAIYFILNDLDCLLYIGQTKNLRKRIEQAYPIKEKNIDIDRCRIAWLELRGSKLIEYEKACVKGLSPLFNERCG
jgi:GIY-YIG catalytic domain